MRYFAALFLALAPLTAAPALALPAETHDTTQVRTAAGIVLDASTGRPLGAVFVQQDGGLDSAFTGAAGQFSLKLEAAAQPRITVTANGYQSQTIAVGSGRNLKVMLSPIAIVTTATAPLRPVVDSVEDTPLLPFDSRVAFAYRARYETQTAPASANGATAPTLAGGANNDYRLALRYRWTRLLFEVEGDHYQVPVDVTGLALSQNPAFSPSTYEGAAKVGYLWELPRGFEGALSATYRYKDTVPNNHDVPYIGSPVDFEQTRHAAGVTATLGYLSPRSPWGFEASLAGFPIVYEFAKAPGSPFANQYGIEGSADVTYEVVRGLRFGVGYRYEGWHGNGDDTSHLVLGQFLYTPVGAFKGSEH